MSLHIHTKDCTPPQQGLSSSFQDTWQRALWITLCSRSAGNGQKNVILVILTAINSFISCWPLVPRGRSGPLGCWSLFQHSSGRRHERTLKSKDLPQAPWSEQGWGIIKHNINQWFPSRQDTDILNTAVLTGKKVVMPVRTVAVEEDGVVTDVSDYTDCSSTNEDVLKVGLRNILICIYTSLKGDAFFIMEIINTCISREVCLHFLCS